MRDFDHFDKQYKNLYNDRVYKVIHADKAFDVGLYEEKYDGFYAVATNLDDDVSDIIEISSNHYKIEDCFRVMKTNFSARPVYHQKRERIIAHFMICYTALIIYRILEKKLNDYGTHFTVENIIETLKNMNVANIEDMC